MHKNKLRKIWSNWHFKRFLCSQNKLWDFYVWDFYGCMALSFTLAKITCFCIVFSACSPLLVSIYSKKSVSPNEYIFLVTGMQRTVQTAFCSRSKSSLHCLENAIASKSEGKLQQGVVDRTYQI